MKVKHLLDILYSKEKPLEDADPKLLGAQRKISAKGLRARAFDYTEHMLEKLWKKTPEKSNNSIIPVPHPFLIAGARFMESYYWDSYFGLQGLLATGRRFVAKMQIENFLYLIENYGHIPNGIRNYYLFHPSASEEIWPMDCRGKVSCKNKGRGTYSKERMKDRRNKAGLSRYFDGARLTESWRIVLWSADLGFI